MEHPGFFKNAGPFSLMDVAEASEAVVEGNAGSALSVQDVRPLDEAGEGDVSFIDNPKYLPQFTTTAASACFVAEKFRDRAPEGTVCLITKEPYRSFAHALGLFYPEAVHFVSTKMNEGPGSAGVDESAELEEGVTIEPGAVIGAEVQIGRGTTIAAGAVIGYRSYVGRDCYIGPNVNISHSLIGDRVIIHAGVSIGQDGFGFAMGPQGHLKVPQIGRVIIQNDVEIGANTTIDRGALKDTVIGEGTKIDNLVQIGHNVVIGRNCIIVAQVGISGSTELGDFVVLGGQAGMVGHIKIGTGAQVAAGSGLKEDVPAGERWGGTPAKPIKDWFRELTLVKNLAEDNRRKKKSD